MSESKDKADVNASSRRSVLRFGAAAIPAFATLKASPAAATASVLECQIPLTLSQTNNKWIKTDGTLVAPNTANSYPPLSSTTPMYSGQELRAHYLGGSMPLSGKKMSTNANLSSSAYNAHVEYIKKLTMGKPGYTCYASIYTSLT